MNTYGAGGPGPFRFGEGRRLHEEQIEARHTSSLPSFGALRRDNTPTAACLVVLSGVLALERESVMFSGLLMNRRKLSEPPLRCAWASFYMLKGSLTGGNAEKGTNVKSEGVGTVTCTVHPT